MKKLAIILLLAFTSFLIVKEPLEVYTTSDILYIDVQDLEITSEGGGITYNFKSYEDLVEGLSDITSAQSTITDVELISLIRDYAMVTIANDDVRIVFTNPYTNKTFSVLMNVQEGDGYNECYYFLD